MSNEQWPTKHPDQKVVGIVSKKKQVLESTHSSRQREAPQTTSVYASLIIETKQSFPSNAKIT